MRLISIISVICLTSVSSQNVKEVQCQYDIIDGVYSCYLEEVNITSAEDRLEFTGNHWDNKTNIDVEVIRTAHVGSSPVIELIHPQFFEEFPNLHELLIRNTQLKSLNLENCENITRIISYQNPLTELPADTFKNCKNLKSLDLWFNEISTTFSSSFGGLESLEYLKLWGNTKVDLFADSLSDSKKLREFYFIGNGLGSIEAGALNHSSTTLEVVGINGFVGLGSVMGDLLSGLSNLAEIDLSENELGNVDVGFFGQFERLKRLTLDRNGIEGLGEGRFSDLGGLVHLSLDFNDITQLTNRTFEGLSRLESLLLSTNAIEGLSSSPLRPLTALTELNLSFNPLRSLTTDVFHSNVNLRVLNLVGCGLYEVTVDVFAPLTRLQQLSLDFNELTAVPAVYFPSQSASLVFLSLSKNHITIIHSYSLSTVNSNSPLSTLTTLLLNRNNISLIERGFFDRLSNLHWLGATNNECIDESVENFTLTQHDHLFDQCYGSAHKTHLQSSLIALFVVLSLAIGGF